MAHRLGMHLHELMGWDGPMTEPQFQTWIAWLAWENERPSRTDRYIMQAGAGMSKQQVLVFNKDAVPPPIRAGRVRRPKKETVAEMNERMIRDTVMLMGAPVRGLPEKYQKYNWVPPPEDRPKRRKKSPPAGER